MNGLRLAMLGTGTFAEPVFQALLNQRRHPVVGLVTKPHHEGGTVRGSTRQIGAGMTTLAQAAGVPVYQPLSINTPEGVEQLRAWQAELLVTAAYGQILKAEVLNATRLGGINVHASPLPKYRGAAPVVWAIARGETETGVTIIRMTTGLDAGEMLAQERVAIGPQETAGELEARLAEIGARIVIDVIDRLAAGPVSGEKQDPALVTKAPKLTKEHGAIDWSKPADEICRLVRAMQPWPTAYTFLHREGSAPSRVLLLKAEPAEGEFGGPGDVRVGSDGKTIEAATSAGIVRVLELQAAGKKRMSATAFLNGHPLRAGDRLGPA
ncbi:MAG: methionyl-tRNA formyltransferase [Gemmataceae bacterium]